MSEGPVLTVGFGCVSPQTGDGLLTMTFADAPLELAEAV